MVARDLLKRLPALPPGLFTGKSADHLGLSAKGVSAHRAKRVALEDGALMSTTRTRPAMRNETPVRISASRGASGRIVGDAAHSTSAIEPSVQKPRGEHRDAVDPSPFGSCEIPFDLIGRLLVRIRLGLQQNELREPTMALSLCGPAIRKDPSF